MKNNNFLKAFTQQLVKSSKLEGNEAANLYDEIYSDLLDKWDDMEFNNEKADIKIIFENFGDEEKIAKEILYSHYPYLRIPIIGDIFIFSSLRLGLLFTLIFIVSILLNLWGIKTFASFPYYTNIDVMRLMTLQTYVIFPLSLIPQIILGIYISNKYSLRQCLKGLIVFSLTTLILWASSNIFFDPSNIISFLPLFPVVLIAVLFSFILTVGIKVVLNVITSVKRKI